MLPAAAAPRCELRPATSWYTTIAAGDYKLLFDDDWDGDQPEPAAHGRTFSTQTTDSFRIVGPAGSCWAAPDVGFATMPLFIGNDRILYIPTYSGSQSILFVVDAKTCRTLWQRPDRGNGIPYRTPSGFSFYDGFRITLGADCLPHLSPRHP